MKCSRFPGNTEVDQEVTLDGDVTKKWQSSCILGMFPSLEKRAKSQVKQFISVTMQLVQ